MKEFKLLAKNLVLRKNIEIKEYSREDEVFKLLVTIYNYTNILG